MNFNYDMKALKESALRNSSEKCCADPVKPFPLKGFLLLREGWPPKAVMGVKDRIKSYIRDEQVQCFQEYVK